MFESFSQFAIYFALAAVLLVAFIAGYALTTPYKDFQLIKQDNNAVAIAMAGAILGFTIPLLSSIYYTKSPLEMTIWALITGIIQFLIVVFLRRQSKEIERGHVASAIIVASLSVSLGMINAVCISH